MKLRCRPKFPSQNCLGNAGTVFFHSASNLTVFNVVVSVLTKNPFSLMVFEILAIHGTVPLLLKGVPINFHLWICTTSNMNFGTKVVNENRPKWYKIGKELGKGSKY